MVMMKMGKVKDGTMIHMVPTNQKLRKRKLRIDKKNFEYVNKWDSQF